MVSPFNTSKNVHFESTLPSKSSTSSHILVCFTVTHWPSRCRYYYVYIYSAIITHDLRPLQSTIAAIIWSNSGAAKFRDMKFLVQVIFMNFSKSRI